MYPISGYLTVLPANSVEIVCRVLKRLHLLIDTPIGITFSISPSPEKQTKLAHFIGDAYETEVLKKRISAIDMCPSCELSLAQYLWMIPSLSRFGQYYGVASNYLANVKEGDRINCSVRASNASFHPPENTRVPIVMVAAGTDIALFRGFIRERAAQLVCGRKVGSDDDFLYSNELDKWSKLGVSMKTCFTKIIYEVKQCNEEEEEAATILEHISQDRHSIDVFFYELVGMKYLGWRF